MTMLLASNSPLKCNEFTPTDMQVREFNCYSCISILVPVCLYVAMPYNSRVTSLKKQWVTKPQLVIWKLKNWFQTPLQPCCQQLWITLKSLIFAMYTVFAEECNSSFLTPVKKLWHYLAMTRPPDGLSNARGN
jgi:hypothetical protein